jgi:CheY-like chemotaxis protein
MPRVAVIDDDDEFSALMQALLEEEGYAYLQPSDLGDPIPELVRRRVDALVLDLHGVAEDGGLALLRRLRSHPSLTHLPVLVCSADIQLLRDHAAELVAIRGAAALEKPFRLEALVGSLERLMAGSLHPPAVGAPPDPAAAAAIEAVLAELGPELRWPALDAWVPDRRPGMLRCVASWAASRRLAAFAQVSRRTLLPFGGGLPGRVWVSNRAAWVEDLVTDMNFPRLPAARRIGLVSAVAVPVRDGDVPVGVLAAYDQRRRTRDDAVLEQLTDRAATLVELARRAAGLTRGPGDAPVRTG